MRPATLTLALFLLLPPAGTAQTAPQPGLVRGVVLECDSESPSGEFAVRDTTNEVFRYRFDAKTYAERDGQLIEASRLKAGEKVEVVSDRTPASAVRYARTIHVIQPLPPPRPLSLGRYRAPQPHPLAIDTQPRSSLEYSGVVARLNGERVVLHTRDSGDMSLLLRADTRFLRDGEPVEAKDLQPNVRVYIRAGKNLYDQVEAYQIIWGTILQPRQ